MQRSKYTSHENFIAYSLWIHFSISSSNELQFFRADLFKIAPADNWTREELIVFNSLESKIKLFVFLRDSLNLLNCVHNFTISLRNIIYSAISIPESLRVVEG